MGERAPVDLVLVEFTDGKFRGEIVAELERLVKAGVVRVADALLVRKDGDGTVTWAEVEASADKRFASIVGEPEEFLAEDDVTAVAADLEPDTAVGMLVFEHSWASGLAGAVRRAGGRLLDWQRVPAEAIEELSAAQGSRA